MPPIWLFSPLTPLDTGHVVFILSVFAQDNEDGMLERKRSKGGLEDWDEEAEDNKFEDRLTRKGKLLKEDATTNLQQ